MLLIHFTCTTLIWPNRKLTRCRSAGIQFQKSYIQQGRKLIFPKLLKQVNVAETTDWKRHSATYMYSMTYGVWFEQQGNWCVLPACCDIDRACPSLLQQHTKLWQSARLQHLPLKPTGKKIIKSLIITDWNNSRPINLIFNCLRTSSVKSDSNPNTDVA